MSHDQGRIEPATRPASDGFPDDYGLARELATTGASEQAERIFRQLLTTADAPRIRATVYNDLATLAALAGDEHKARRLLSEAFSLDPHCPPARENWTTLGLGQLPACDTPASEPVRDKVKVAIVSGMFNWPSAGGGNVHTVQLAQALRCAGYTVEHFYLEYEPWSIGHVEHCPARSQPIQFNDATWTLQEVQRRVAAAVRQSAPDVVLLTDCWSLKPWLAAAVRDFPYLLRFDGLECLCPLNNLRVIPHPNRQLEACTKHRLATPDACRTCVQQHSQFVGRTHQWEREFSRFDTAEYHALLLRSLTSAAAVLVHNPLIATMLEPYAATVRVVPIGARSDTFGEIPLLEPNDRRPVKRILFGGRTRDLVKGFQVLRAAADTLWQTRQDFRIVATGECHGPDAPFIEWLGWQAHEGMPALLAEAQIVAAPAVASEPFGLTIIEAMAAARPVVASRVGGQQFTVVDGLTGLLCEPDNPHDLAAKLAQLLDSAELQAALGVAGRRRFQAEYAWDVVINRHYRPLLDATMPAHKTSCANSSKGIPS